MNTTTPASFTLEELLSHRAWAQRLARRLVGPADADDLVQDGWVAGLTARPADRDGLRPWLATVLARAAGKRRRGDQRRSHREQEGTALAQATVPAPEALVAQLEVQRLLADLVLALEPAVREVILLRFYQGLTSPEIARELAIPEGTVRWRIKVGLDELRQRLDQKHGGREAWMGVLAPIAGTGRPMRGPALAAALTAGAMLVAGVVSWTVMREGSTGTGASVERAFTTQSAPAAAGPGASPSGAAGGGRPPQLAAAVATADECRQRLAEIRQNIVAHEPEFVKTAQMNAPAALFDHGAPNPAAEAVLAPLVKRVLDAAGAAQPAGHTLTCRTLICRLKLLVPAGAPSFEWEMLLRQDGELSEHALGSSSRESGPTIKDPLTSASYREDLVYLRLWTPSAEPFSRAKLIVMGGPPKLPTPVFGPLPARLDACRSELAAAEQRLATMKDVIQRHMLPDRRWERSRPNAALTAEMDALARKILALPAESRDVIVECRHDICRVDFDRQAFPRANDTKKLTQAPEWWRRMGHSLVGGWRAHFTILPPKPATP